MPRMVRYYQVAAGFDHELSPQTVRPQASTQTLIFQGFELVER